VRYGLRVAWSRTSDSETSSISEAIRADIVRGRRRTGSEIVLAEISEQLDVPLSIVQQSLLSLVEQRLVHSADDGSFRVVSVSPQDLAELTTLRQLVEGEAVRLAVAQGDESWRDSVLAAHAALADAEAGMADPARSEDWRAAHIAFHESLCAAAGNGRLLAIVGSLRDEAEIYRELSGFETSADRRADVSRQHRTLMELAVGGRADKAAQALRDHLEGTRRSIADTALAEE
jgi:GntR family carbon starvation induced transcriptional regulator